MTEKREELLAKMRQAQEQREDLEKLKRQVLKDEEEKQEEEHYAYQVLEDSIYQWQEDNRLQRIFYMQQEILNEMRQKRSQFTEEWEKQTTQEAQRLSQLEEDYQNQVRQMNRDDAKEEKADEYNH